MDNDETINEMMLSSGRAVTSNKLLFKIMQTISLVHSECLYIELILGVTGTHSFP